MNINSFNRKIYRLLKNCNNRKSIFILIILNQSILDSSIVYNQNKNITLLLKAIHGMQGHGLKRQVAMFGHTFSCQHFETPKCKPCMLTRRIT